MPQLQLSQPTFLILPGEEDGELHNRAHLAGCLDTCKIRALWLYDMTARLTSAASLSTCVELVSPAVR
jgi:hypothetical protein